jgi:Lipase (class 2)
MGPTGALFGRLGWPAPAAVAAALAAVAMVVAPGARAQGFAPVDQPGPALSVPAPDLAAALKCSGDLSRSGREPVLLVPGTTMTPEKNFSWNWIRALNAQGRPWCSVELPGSAMADIQVAGEYVVSAIRTMHQRAKSRIDVLGHSQGGMVPRWALRFWPDVRAMVDDQVGMAPSNHGTLDSIPVCLLGCAPAFWQQAANSNFIRALNSHQETFAGIDYTAIYTITDEVVTPNLDDSGSSALRPGGGGAITNVAIQDVCPTDLAEHLAIGTIDNTAYRLAIDALDHPGPADPARIPRSVCLKPLMPGVNPLTAVTDLAATGLYLATVVATYPHVPAEPPLACYTTATCPSGG